jgi:hypothetical protein
MDYTQREREKREKKRALIERERELGDIQNREVSQTRDSTCSLRDCKANYLYTWK